MKFVIPVPTRRALPSPGNGQNMPGLFREYSFHSYEVKNENKSFHSLPPCSCNASNKRDNPPSARTDIFTVTIQFLPHCWRQPSGSRGPPPVTLPSPAAGFRSPSGVIIPPLWRSVGLVSRTRAPSVQNDCGPGSFEFNTTPPPSPLRPLEPGSAAPPRCPGVCAYPNALRSARMCCLSRGGRWIAVVAGRGELLEVACKHLDAARLYLNTDIADTR